MSDTTTIPEGGISLPLGGWAVLAPFEEMTGAQLRRIRKAMDVEGAGTVGNALYASTIAALVTAWHIPYQEGLGVPAVQPAALDLLRAPDLLALERHVEPYVEEIMGKRKKDPSQPGSD